MILQSCSIPVSLKFSAVFYFLYSLHICCCSLLLPLLPHQCCGPTGPVIRDPGSQHHRNRGRTPCSNEGQTFPGPQCTARVRCSQGFFTVELCTGGLVWDQSSKTCKLPSQVSKCSDVILSVENEGSGPGPLCPLAPSYPPTPCPPLCPATLPRLLCWASEPRVGRVDLTLLLYTDLPLFSDHHVLIPSHRNLLQTQVGTCALLFPFSFS